MLFEPRVEVLENDFDLGQCWSDLQKAVGLGVGAMAGFTGLVREATKTAAGGSRVDEPVKALVLEHYPGMTEDSMGRIVAEAAERWDLLGVHVVHRVGRLLPGEQIVMVIVASAHRADAFSACEFIMDYLKTDAVLWKREDYLVSDGNRDVLDEDQSDSTAGDTSSRWLHSADQDKSRREGWKREA